MSVLFKSVVILLRARLRNSQIEAHIEKCSVSLFCHEGELRQIMLNIVGNSIDAMKHGGLLHLRCKKIRNHKLSVSGTRITIADTGTGMNRDTLTKMCEAFFTTKGIGGTGLGLWVTQDLVRKNGGVMRVRSSTNEPHRGTVFALFFPQAPQ
jgi:signal transduction histidine kinase